MEKEQRKSFLLWDICFCFMLMVFAPLEVYLTNKNEFWFGPKQILPIITCCLAVSILVLYGIYWLIRRNKRFSVVYTILLGILIGLYIQGNYIPRNYGVLDGTDIQWDQFANYGVASIILWAVIALLVIFACIKLNKIIYWAGQIICACFLAVQIITIGVLILQIPTYSKNINTVVTSQGLYELSDNKNVVVFLLDAFDSSILLDMLERDEGEKCKQVLEDFTYYPDASGGYPSTMGSLPFILTGKWYENEVPYAEYVENAYKETDLYDVLQEENYNIGLYTDSLFINSQTDRYENVFTGQYQLTKPAGFIRSLYKMAIFNYVPHQIKRYFVTYSEDFLKYRKTEKKESVYSYDVPEFYDGLLENRLKLNTEKNVFRFYHLDGTHPPFTFDGNLENDYDTEFNVYDEAMGCCNLLNEYFEQLKQLGIYDNTAVIIMADHGLTSNNWSNLNLNPLLLIKDFGESHPFEVSDTAVSWEDISGLFRTLASGENSKDFLKEAEKQERRFLQYSWDSGWKKDYLPRMAEYKIMGKAYEDENDAAVPTGKIYVSKAEEHTERFLFTENVQIPIDENDEGYQKLVLGGLSGVECPYGTSFVWTDAGYTYFTIELEPGYSKNVKLILDYANTVGESDQRVIAYANGIELQDVVIQNNKIYINIPNECITDSKLDLIAYYPDAYTPADENKGEDMRKLAFRITGISLEEY